MPPKKATPPKSAPKRAQKRTQRARKKPTAAWSAAREAQHEIKREIIIKAAIRALHAHGYHATSLREIARQIGMTDAALYYYFKNKSALAFAALKASHARVGEFLEEAADAPSGLEQVKTFTQRVVGAFTEREIWLSALEPYWLTPDNLKAHNTLMQENHARLADFIRAGVADKTVRLCEPTTTAALIGGVVFFVRDLSPLASLLGATHETLSHTTADLVTTILSAENPLSGGFAKAVSLMGGTTRLQG